MVFTFTQYGRNRERVQQFQELALDALVHFPASSVEVEKLHANLQLTSHVRKGAGQQAGFLQQNSYILSTYLEHRALREAVDTECLGTNQNRASCLLRARNPREALPCNASTKLKRRTPKARRFLGQYELLSLVVIII